MSTYHTICNGCGEFISATPELDGWKVVELIKGSIIAYYCPDCETPKEPASPKKYPLPRFKPGVSSWR